MRPVLPPFEEDEELFSFPWCEEELSFDSSDEDSDLLSDTDEGAGAGVEAELALSSDKDSDSLSDTDEEAGAGVVSFDSSDKDSDSLSDTDEGSLS